MRILRFVVGMWFGSVVGVWFEACALVVGLEVVTFLICGCGCRFCCFVFGVGGNWLHVGGFWLVANGFPCLWGWVGFWLVCWMSFWLFRLGWAFRFFCAFWILAIWCNIDFASLW